MLYYIMTYKRRNNAVYYIIIIIIIFKLLGTIKQFIILVLCNMITS